MSNRYRSILSLGSSTPPFSNVNSFSFDGVDDYFLGTSTYSELDGQSKATFSFWIKPTNLTPRYSFVLHIPRNTTGTNGQITIFLDNNNRIRWSMDTSSYYIFSNSNAITLGQWNHVLICVDLSITDEGRIFVDGVDQTALDNLNTRNFFSTSSGGLMIGENTYGYLNPFLGNIDEVAIWSGTDQRANVSEIYGGGEAVDLNNLATAPPPTTWSRIGDNATWNGATWTMTDVNGGYTNRSINMVEANRTTDVPTIPFSTKSIALDGVDDYVDCSNPSNLNFERTDSFSISVWFKKPSSSVAQFIIGKNQHAVPRSGYFVFTSGNLVYFRLTTSGGNNIQIRHDSTHNIDVWEHYVFTYDGSSSSSGLNIYQNETLLTNVTRSGANLTQTIQTSFPFTIGAREGLGLFFDGKIDEASVFNSELSQSDITTIYNGGAPNDISSLSPISWWRCGDGDTSPTLTDNGSGGNDGTMTNFTTFSTDVPT